MSGDKFISTTKNMFNQNYLSEEETNFFVQGENPQKRKLMQTEPIKHLNDYDGNILQESSYKEVQDDVFKLEYKISKIEEELKEINTQIQTANEICDYYTAEFLQTRKAALENDLKNLMDLYRETCLSAKISGSLTSRMKENFISTGKLLEKFCGFFISKIPGKLSSIFKIRESLSKLENINKSVDELMKSRYPYGEAGEKYEQLSKYIARANTIQADIYKLSGKI